jgi:superfamily II DNA or RNA helicase
MMDKKHMMKGNDKMKFSEKSDRLKAMIMTKYDVSDERTDEIKMKYREKHGEMTDKHKSDLKMKYKKHMSSVKSNMSDERRLMIHDRIAEMKAFKADLRANSADMTDKQKQELREEFIEKAKDMQLAWISPRTQMTAGVDAAEVECREGFSLVLKESNGVAMCLKADTALKMIDRGVVVPSI